MEKNKKKNKSFKATWDEDNNESSTSSSSENEKANVCLMASTEVLSPISIINSVTNIDSEYDSSNTQENLETAHNMLL